MTAEMDVKMRIFDIFKDPATSNVLHSKLWANVIYTTGAFRFVMLPDPLTEIWAVYSDITSGYVVTHSFVNVKRQELESDHAHETD